MLGGASDLFRLVSAVNQTSFLRATIHRGSRQHMPDAIEALAAMVGARRHRPRVLLNRDALVQRLDQQIDEAADDTNALTAEDRAQSLDACDAVMLPSISLTPAPPPRGIRLSSAAFLTG